MGIANHTVWRRQRSVANHIFHRALPIEIFGQIAIRMFGTIDEYHSDGNVDIADYLKGKNIH